MIELDQYRTIFFDFDGVLIDSNVIKEKNISQATTNCFGQSDRNLEFITYFNSLPGLPREAKISKFFGPSDSEKLLKAYQELNLESFKQIKLTLMAELVIKQLFASGRALYILSGGNQDEIERILTRNQVDTFFQSILCAPCSKQENLARVSFERPALLIGDSKVDLETAITGDLDFIFMSKYSGWENGAYEANKNGFRSITDFEEFFSSK